MHQPMNSMKICILRTTISGTQGIHLVEQYLLMFIYKMGSFNCEKYGQYIIGIRGARRVVYGGFISIGWCKRVFLVKIGNIS